jgi:hypothetical protein
MDLFTMLLMIILWMIVVLILGSMVFIFYLLFKDIAPQDNMYKRNFLTDDEIRQFNDPNRPDLCCGYGRAHSCVECGCELCLRRLRYLQGNLDV